MPALHSAFQTNPRPVPFPKDFFKAIYNFVGLPFRTFLLKEPWTEKIGLRTLEQERVIGVWPYLRGRILDVGAGDNTLVRLYQNGVGVDVHDWGHGVQVVPDTAHLPFGDGEYDTVCLVACLNHIPNREEVLKEVRRVLKPGGRCLATMINPIFGFLAHTLRWNDEHHHRGGMEEGELNGLWHPQMLQLLRQSGFDAVDVTSFFYGCNRLYIAEKR